MKEVDASDPRDPRVMNGEIWEELCDTLRRAGARVAGPDVPATPLDRAVGYRYLTQFVEAGINFCVAHGDGDYPEFTRMMDMGMRWGLDSPDCLYIVATVKEGREYRIWGDPGTSNHMDIQLNTGHYALGDIAAVRTLGSISRDDFVRGPDGGFEVFLGGEERGSNWVPSGPEAGFVLVRQNFLDWANERPGSFQIERVGAPVEKPDIRTDQVAERIDVLRSWVEKGGALWETMSRGMLSLEPNTTVTYAPDESEGNSGLKGQIYCQGNFRCHPDEAVIFEAVPPPARHWNVSLANFYWEAVDFMTRQGSLNGCQAELDEDGVFRAVIAHRDPGVPNWLDPCGQETGTLILRFILAQEKLESPVSRVVPFDSVQAELPAGTRRVSPAEREQRLRERREALWMRYRR